MKKKYIILIVIAVLLLAGCNSKKEEKVIEEVNKIEFKSINNDFVIETDDTWKQLEQGAINSEAVLEISGKELLKYGLILSDDKKYFTNFDTWYNSISPRLSKGYKYDLNKVKDTKINGYEAKVVSFDTSVGDYDFYMTIYFINTDNHYVQLLLYAPLSEKEYVGKEFIEIANSFKEV